MRLTIGKKIVSLLLLMVFIGVVNILLIYHYLTMQKEDSRIINIAGRQRMLSQKITKLALSIADGNDNDRLNLRKAIELYDTSLRLLHYGGESIGEQIPPAPVIMEELFKKDRDVWDLFKEKAEIVVKDDRYNLSFSEAILYIEKHNEALLQSSSDIVTAYTSLPDAGEYIHEISVAGRQRMLSQQIAKYAFSVSTGGEDKRDQLQHTIELYDRSFLSLRDGGKSIPWGEQIKPAPPAARDFLNILENEWDKFKEKANVIQREPRHNIIFQQAVDYIKAHNDELLDVSDEVSATLDKIFGKKVLNLKMLLLVMLGFDIFVFFVGCVMANKIAKPIRKLSKLAKDIGESGFLRKIELPDSNDEIGQLAHSFNKMIEDLKEVTVSRTSLEKLVFDRTVKLTNSNEQLQRKIKEHKQAQEMLQKSKKKLEFKATELENVNKELKETTVQLIQSSKLSALGELSAGVADEVTQPLNNIQFICQTKLMDLERNGFSDNERIKSDMLDIVTEVGRITEIIDQMRTFTRKAEDMPREKTDVNSAIEGAFKLIGTQLKVHNIEVVRGLDPNLPETLANQGELEQVFTNLIVNARDAVEDFRETERKIEIRSYENHGGENQSPEIIVEVKDNGGGISSETKNRIFEPFFTTKRSDKGTGLGLSIVDRLVKEHKGRVEVESRIGEGSLFRVILPVHD